MFYRSRANLKHYVKLCEISEKIKTRFLQQQLKQLKSYDHVNYAMVDINCRLKVVFKDGSGNSFYRHHEIKRNLGKGRHQSSLVFLCLCITVVLRFEH